MLLLIIQGDKVEIGKIYDDREIIHRGDIFDRNSVIVATDLKTKSLYINSILLRDKRAVAKAIIGVIPEIKESEILSKLKHSDKKNWILIKRNITPIQEQKIRNLKIASLIFENDMVRVYPHKSIASHMIGYVDIDRNGLSGIEMQYNSDLKNGKSVHLAMDIRLQDILHTELSSAVSEFGAEGGSGIILDATNGEVLAMVSLPDFDSNNPAEYPKDSRFNNAIQGVYELGSVFKIFTNAVAFEKKVVKPSDVLYVGEPIRYGRFTIDDLHRKKDYMSVEEIFAYSSNIGTVHIISKVGGSKQKDFLKSLGLLDKLDSDFAGLARPIYPKTWRDISMYTIAYGHGIAVTPMHLAAAVVPMVNGGIFYHPSFAKKTSKESGTRVISEKTSEMMRTIMRKVVTDGTGRNAKDADYEIMGKTGTGEKLGKYGYESSSNIASFVSAFPAKNPKYVIYVVIDNPKNKFTTGGMVAAPVVAKVIKEIAPIAKVMPAQLSSPAE